MWVQYKVDFIGTLELKWEMNRIKHNNMQKFIQRRGYTKVMLILDPTDLQKSLWYLKVIFNSDWN